MCSDITLITHKMFFPQEGILYVDGFDVLLNNYSELVGSIFGSLKIQGFSFYMKTHFRE